MVTPGDVIKQMEGMTHADRYSLMRALITGLRMCGTLDAWLVDDMQHGLDAISWVSAKVNWVHELNIDKKWLSYANDFLDAYSKGKGNWQ
jgi:hypothetical protein